MKTFNHIGIEEFGGSYKPLMNDEKHYRRLVNATWFFGGLVAATLFLHHAVIMPCLNQII